MLFPDRHDWQAVVRGVAFLVGLCVAINLIAFVRIAHGREFSRDTTRLPVRLQMALKTADAACGIVVDNTWRRGATIAGTGGSPSMHRFWRAADITSRDYPCVLRVLSDWNGCMSIDWRSARHIHIDTSGNRSCRFRHGGHKKRVRAFARQSDKHRSM